LASWLPEKHPIITPEKLKRIVQVENAFENTPFKR
jgi:hypothetical protein